MEKTSIKIERKIDRFDKFMKINGLNDNKVTVELGLSVGVLGKSRKNNLAYSSSLNAVSFVYDSERAADSVAYALDSVDCSILAFFNS